MGHLLDVKALFFALVSSSPRTEVVFLPPLGSVFRET
jgi:hypothetical protein